MIGYGFSARHWQQIEAGRPITIRTLLRICETFGVKAADLIEGLDRGYLQVVPLLSRILVLNCGQRET